MHFLDSLRALVALALISLFGIVMMLLVDGLWDDLMLLLAALPILLGSGRALWLARRPRASLRD